jgi:LysW-gamma-L-lysine carboxypeptidase
MVAFGPGDSAYDHTPMERLRLDDHARAIAVLRGVLRRAASHRDRPGEPVTRR